MSENKNNETNTNKRKRGGQPGNKNAVGNRGGTGATAGNKHALKHGKYTAKRKAEQAKKRTALKYGRLMRDILGGTLKAINLLHDMEMDDRKLHDGGVWKGPGAE